MPSSYTRRHLKLVATDRVADVGQLPEIAALTVDVDRLPVPQPSLKAMPSLLQPPLGPGALRLSPDGKVAVRSHDLCHAQRTRLGLHAAGLGGWQRQAPDN